MPESFLVDDSLVIKPSLSGDVFRGPNIGEPPFTEPLMDSFKGIIGLKVGDKITTDHIMPAGARLKYRSNIPAYANYVFEGVDASFAKRSLEAKSKSLYTAVIAGLSYGQGSSREHAAICPMYLGVRLVIAKSFERIHSANLINFGILPLYFVNEADYDSIEQGSEFEIKNLRSAVESGAKEVQITISGKTYTLKMDFSERQRKILIDGGLLNYTKKVQK